MITRVDSYIRLKIVGILLAFCLCIMQSGCTKQSGLYAADALTITVTDEDGSAGRINAPVSATVKLPENLREGVRTEQLYLTELTADGIQDESIPAQFEQDPAKPNQGKIWWLMPSGQKGERRFRLTAGKDSPKPVMTVHYDKDRKWVNVSDNNIPVLRYNHGPTSVPDEIEERFARGDYPCPPYDPNGFARGDYISPLYGPAGEVLTEDYPMDHPHHRAVNWSWATLRWQGQERDMFAVRGVWARPICLKRAIGGPMLAIIDAENQWKWDDRKPIVHEQVIIRAFRQVERCRCVDIEIRLKALVDGLEFCGRIGVGYSGFNLRMAPAQGQQIVLHNDPPQTNIRRSWADYSANFKGGKGRTGVAVLQHKTNPLYPSEWLKYETLNFFQPAYPGPKLIPIPKSQTIILKYRLWIHSGTVTEKVLSDLWTAYNLNTGHYLNIKREGSK